MTTTAEEARREVIQAMGEEDAEPDPIAYELEYLWDDLNSALNNAMNGVWSIRCESVVHRIVSLTRHTGEPTPWGAIQIRLLLDGTYEAIHEAMGMPTPLSNEERAHVQFLWDDMQRKARELAGVIAEQRLIIDESREVRP